MSLLETATKRRFDAQFDAIRLLDPASLIAEGERYRHSIKDARFGGFIRLGIKTYLVREVGKYEETDDKFRKKAGDIWYELKLFCLETGEEISIEWEEDDELVVSLTTGFLKFSQLRDDEGGKVDEDDLDDLAEEEDSLFHQGKRFDYDDDCAAIYTRSDGRSEQVYMYDFEATDGTQLTVEEWVVDKERDKYEYQIFLARSVDPDSIEILSTGGG